MTLGDMKHWPRSLQIVSVAFAASLALDAALALRLMRPGNNDVTLEPLVLRDAPRIVVLPTQDAETLRQAENRTPFDAGGAPPPLLSGPLTPTTPPQPVSRQPRLVGTVVEGHGGFVVVEMPDAHMQVVRIGEQAGELRLRAVSAGEASFEDAKGARITLRSAEKLP
ncbi:MAG: hypothetical protein M3Z05_20970 [Gemmatimonadota bacterium]|nr:hypothetical protein [Gemmatimonadota bacterium]